MTDTLSREQIEFVKRAGGYYRSDSDFVALYDGDELRHALCDMALRSLDAGAGMGAVPAGWKLIPADQQEVEVAGTAPLSFEDKLALDPTGVELSGAAPDVGELVKRLLVLADAADREGISGCVIDESAAYAIREAAALLAQPAGVSEERMREIVLRVLDAHQDSPLTLYTVGQMIESALRHSLARGEQGEEK